MNIILICVISSTQGLLSTVLGNDCQVAGAEIKAFGN